METATTATTTDKARARAQVLKTARQLHLWLGTFFAPAIIFFAFSGALQTFGLHEAQRGDPNQPAMWITKLAQLHKKQNLNTKPAGARPAKKPEDQVKPREENRPAPKPDKPATFAFKVFTGLMSIGLILTTVLGLFMTFQFARDKRVTWALLILGTLLPLAMILLM